MSRDDVIGQAIFAKARAERETLRALLVEAVWHLDRNSDLALRIRKTLEETNRRA